MTSIGLNACHGGNPAEVAAEANAYITFVAERKIGEDQNPAQLRAFLRLLRYLPTRLQQLSERRNTFASVGEV
jgi:hypothetical protein